MTELIQVNYEDNGRPTVSGRELHEALEVKEKYTDWFKRMCAYGFEETEDYTLVSEISETNNPKNPYTERISHSLTIPMAKELCMLQRTEKGKFFRQYFIKVEEAWNSPEMIMKRALEIANANVKKLQIEVSALTVENQIMQPKADYFDELVDRNLLTGIRETAKELKIKQHRFVQFLLDKKYLYRTLVLFCVAAGQEGQADAVCKAGGGRALRTEGIHEREDQLLEHAAVHHAQGQGDVPAAVHCVRRYHHDRTDHQARRND